MKQIVKTNTVTVEELNDTSIIGWVNVNKIKILPMRVDGDGTVVAILNNGGFYNSNTKYFSNPLEAYLDSLYFSLNEGYGELEAYSFDTWEEAFKWFGTYNK